MRSETGKVLGTGQNRLGTSIIEGREKLYSEAESCEGEGLTALGRCQYARNSISASRRASFPIVVGIVFKRPVFRRSVRMEREAVIMFIKMSSRRRLRKVRPSDWSLSGRKSERMASAE